jgi:penicillin-insensitive murein endopeptidase
MACFLSSAVGSLLALLVGCASNLAYASTDLSQGPVEQAVGFYSSGSLINAMNLPNQGDGFIKLFVSRDRAWSTFDLQAVLARVSHEIRRQHPNRERIQIGDMSQRTGGFVGRHSSHQNGLDADISYFRMNNLEQAIEHNGFAETFVRNRQVTVNFDIERNWALMRALVGTGRVTRLFVDVRIKKAFCDYTTAAGTRLAETETLRILRPWPNHADHIHVRLSCPQNSPNCTPQAEPPVGDGCADLQLAWWDSPFLTFNPFKDREPGFDD